MEPKEPSFEKINYSLRPNKNVQRKLVVQLLNDVLKLPGLRQDEYQYVGMGSPWFTDFVLMHRALDIKKMISIEREMGRARRMRFNLPFSNIKLRIGPTTEVLPRINLARPTVIWLDYDDELKNYMFEDIGIVLKRLKSGSILILTVNAEFDQLEHVETEGTLLSPENVLHSIAGDSVPSSIQDRLNKTGFASLVAEIFANAIRSKLLERRLDFAPFFNFSYKDGVRMVTFGGMVADKELRVEIQAQNLGKKFSWIASNGQTNLQLPHLTFKEKLRFDELLPARQPPSPSKLGFELKGEEIRQYSSYYLLYPVFAEWLP
ncbi:MAG: hypothetical protein IH977_04060 [Nitrospinae bacterium]|nr:hypothetical protein [Nitrospinota bacterium]